MGLDNIPHVYPCKKAGTAILTDDDRIDCDATIAAQQCPWSKAQEGQGRGTPVYGLFGVPCWYRGKVGGWMLDALAGAGWSPPPELDGGFYGTEGGEDADLSPEYCKALGDWMADHIEAFATTVEPPEEREAALEQYRYAAWWLRWIAEAGDGSDTWS